MEEIVDAVDAGGRAVSDVWTSMGDAEACGQP